MSNIKTQLPLVFYELHYESGRLNVALLMLETISQYEKFNKLPIVKRKKMVYEFEQSIYKKIYNIFDKSYMNEKACKKFNDMYNNLAYEMIFNISDKIKPKNDDLINRILNEDLSINDYVNMDFKKVNEKLNKSYELMKINRMNVQFIEKYSKLFQCPRCEHKEVIYEDRYNRSLDEATNKTFFCNFCQYTWNG